MGVVYYANYLVWFEVARTDLLRHAGWTYREMEEAGFSLPVIEAHCDYQQSARYDDELDIEAAGCCCPASACDSTTGSFGRRTPCCWRPGTPSTPRSIRRAGRAACRRRRRPIFEAPAARA